MRPQPLINTMLWDRADWLGVSHMVDPFGMHPPMMALLFRSELAGRSVFNDLLRKIGPDDPEGRLRVAIIEGEIPRQRPGYTIHLGPYLDNETARAQREAGDALEATVAVISRVCRMSPTPGSMGLAMFKEAYARARRCVLMSAGPTPRELSLDSGPRIWKTDLVFRRAEDISRTGPDQDQVVL
ncbi:MAG: hypothetical protein JNM07_09270 [Phycisphaerae bacterium]|nr:hypothetical protein [Phycisphaerae bacterium]